MSKYFVSICCCFIIHSHATPLQQLKQQCQSSSAEACYLLGHRYDQKSHVTLAVKFYKRACQLKHAMGCSKLAELYLIGSGVKQSDTQFMHYMQSACELGHTESCSVVNKTNSVAESSPKKRALVRKIKPNTLAIGDKNIGRIQIRAKLIDSQKRIIQIDASMINHFKQASGWLSFSFPGIQQSILTDQHREGFTDLRSYPKGSSIYHLKQKKAITSKYLLIEGESLFWKKESIKKLHIKLKIPKTVNILTIYVRGAFKHNSQLRSIPTKGTMGQQGFYNARLTLPVASVKKRISGIKIEHINTSSKTLSTIPSQVILSRKDKLILLDQLFHFSYYHRERKNFEKQLQETLFGGAKYLTTIKTYHCTPQKGTSKNHCILQLYGKASKEQKNICWEFHLAFTAKKDAEGLRITELHSLDLLE